MITHVVSDVVSVVSDVVSVVSDVVSVISNVVSCDVSRDMNIGYRSP